jgi:hypothetical protein
LNTALKIFVKYSLRNSTQNNIFANTMTSITVRSFE